MRIKFGFLLSMVKETVGGAYDPVANFREQRITAWLVKVGDKVTEDSLIVQFATDKVDVEVPLAGLCNTIKSGVIAKLNYNTGDTWKYLGVAEVPGDDKMFLPELGWIETDENSHETLQPSLPAETAEVSVEKKPASASPAARKLAHENGVDINAVKGTGSFGKVMRKDVEWVVAEIKRRETLPPQSAVKPTSERAVADDRVPLNATQIRKTIAYFMQKSHAEIPKAGDAITVDITNLWEFYQKRQIAWREDTRTDFSFTGIFMFLSAKLLHEQKDRFGIINAYWDKDESEAYLFKHVNIGIAVQTADGLMVPVIHNAEALSFREFMTAVHAKIQGAMSRKITMPELRDLTFTVNNVGAMGGESPDSIVPYTREANGKERPTGMILVLTAKWEVSDRQYMRLAFSFDHRLFDGAPGLEFVRAIRSYIESKRYPDEFRELFSEDFSLLQSEK